MRIQETDDSEFDDVVLSHTHTPAAVGEARQQSRSNQTLE